MREETLRVFLLLLEIFRSLHEWQLLNIAQKSSEEESRWTSWKRRWDLKEPSRAGSFRETQMWVVRLRVKE